MRVGTKKTPEGADYGVGRQGLRGLTWETRLRVGGLQGVSQGRRLSEVKSRHWHFWAHYLALRPNTTTLELRPLG